MKYFYLSIALISQAYAVEEMRSLPSFQGYRGVVNTPNSEVMNEGEFEFLYTNQVQSRDYSFDFRKDKEQENFFLNFGLFPNLDLTFQYAYATDNVKNYDHLTYPSNNNYLNNRTVGLKYKLPFIPKNLFSAAIGVDDITGGNRYKGSKYLVGSKEMANVRMSLGYARGETAASLDGVFGSLEYQPLSWVQIAGEYDTKEWNGVLKANYPLEIDRQIINLGAMAKSSSDYHDVYFGIYANMPFHNKSKKINKKLTEISSKLTLNDLKLSNSSFLEKDDIAYFEYENDLYVYNDIDTLGVVLGILSTTTSSKNLHVVIKKANMVQYVIEVNREEYKQFLKDGKYRSNLLQFTNKAGETELEIKNSDRFKPTLTLSPDMVIVDGTEYTDVIDYSIAMQAELSLPLAKGTILSGRYSIPLSQSFNFEEGGLFSYRNRYKTSAELDQALLSQYLKFDTTYPWVNLLQVGRFDKSLEGVSIESSLSDSMGKHHLLLKLSKLDDSLSQRLDAYINDKREEKLLSYRYYFDSLNTNIKLTGGEFLYGDRGASLSMERYFSDTSLKFYLSHTDHDQKGSNNFFRLTLAVPFGVEKNFRTDYLNIKGGELVYNKIKTVVSGSNSYSLPHHGKEVENSFTIEKHYLNKDRFHPTYIKANHNRLRNVFIDSK